MTNPLLERLLELQHRTLNNITSKSNDFLNLEEEKEYESIKSQLNSLIADGEKWRKYCKQLADNELEKLSRLESELAKRDMK